LPLTFLHEAALFTIIFYIGYWQASQAFGGFSQSLHEMHATITTFPIFTHTCVLAIFKLSCGTVQHLQLIYE
jgi:hypothetical protein